MHLGIDYGSKLAGTTAICYQEGNELVILQSEKKKDADKFIEFYIATLNPAHVFIDAPLSLPGAYFGKGDDYFYRACDKELKAMSPMFLGCFFVSAPKLTEKFKQMGIECYESYPAAFVKDREAMMKDYNKKSMMSTSFVKNLEELIGLKVSGQNTWHQIDAVICWYIGKRYLEGEGKVIGDKGEGRILF